MIEIRLKELLTERNMTLADFSKKLGVAYTSLAPVSSFSPTLKLLTKYANAPNVPVWELIHDCGEHCVGIEDEKNATPDVEVNIADDAEETEMISVAESKRRMRKALQLLLDNLGRIRPETLDRIVEQACK